MAHLKNKDESNNIGNQTKGRFREKNKGRPTVKRKKANHREQRRDGTPSYIPLIQEMLEASEPLPTGVYVIDVFHDETCPLWSGGVCNCNPDVDRPSRVPMPEDN